jgi:hypothetical protein
MADEGSVQEYTMPHRTTQALIEQPDDLVVERATGGDETPTFRQPLQLIRAIGPSFPPAVPSP